MILPVTSISSALSSSSLASPLSCARSMSCMTCCTLNLPAHVSCQQSHPTQCGSRTRCQSRPTHPSPPRPSLSTLTKIPVYRNSFKYPPHHKENKSLAYIPKNLLLFKKLLALVT